MKNLLWSILAIASFFAIDLKAQTIRYKQTKLVVADVSRFLGSDDKYHYYSYDFFSSNYTQFEIANLANHKTIEVQLGNETEGKPQLYFLNKKIYILRTDTKKEKDSKVTETTMEIFKINPLNGEIEKSVKYTNKDTIGYFKFFVDTVQNRFFIKKVGYRLFHNKRDDSTCVVYSLDLEPSNETEIQFGKRKPKHEEYSLFELYGLSYNFQIGFSSFFLNEHPESHSDSLCTNNYKFSFQRRNDKDIYFFTSVIQNIVITSKNKNNKVKSVDFAIDIDKNIIDINYREDKIGNLFVFGKYIQKGKGSSSYGLFSCIFDAKLDEVVAVKYFDLVNIPNIENNTVPNQKYVGFIFKDLFGADYEFYFDEQNAFIFTYQKQYNNVQDHIYILKVEANGEMIVNVIYNQIYKDINIDYSEKHMALRVGNNIHILFYENLDNIGKEVNSIDMLETTMGKKNCVLAYTTYKLLDDDFTKKILIADLKTLGNMPNLKEPVIYYNPESNQYTAIVKGFSKKRNLASLFEFIYVD
jgi:hypothetical protein